MSFVSLTTQFISYRPALLLPPEEASKHALKNLDMASTYTRPQTLVAIKLTFASNGHTGDLRMQSSAFFFRFLLPKD